MRRRHHTNSEAGFDFNPLIPNGMRLYQGHEFDKEHIKFQSTHPKRDETVVLIRSPNPGLDFNPLIPNGMRLVPTGANLFTSVFQSTHPKRDETAQILFELRTSTYFNPLIPNGMRPSENRSSAVKITFQSTHPKRDETLCILIEDTNFLISIHSSQTG